MPLYAFDQFEVSEKGREPDLKGDLEGVGMRRSDGAKAYVKALQEALRELSTEQVGKSGVLVESKDFLNGFSAA